MNLTGNLKLRLLLRVTLMLLKRAQARSPRVQQLMRGEPFVFQIRTHAGAGGWFELRDGGITLHRGLHPAPTFCQSWCDGGAAFAALASGDETELLRAAEDGRCRLQGSLAVALWFNEAMKIARNPPAAPRGAARA